MNTSLHDYQKYGVKKLIEEPNIGLFLDMGLGKTLITLTAIYSLIYERFMVKKVLVIAPKKVAEATWQMEIEKWSNLHNLRTSTVLGSEKQRIKALYTPADIYIINRDNVVWLTDFYKNDWPFDMVVCDEFTSFKNHQSKRFKALAAMRPHIKRLVGLTGTPSPNGLLDLWAEIYLLDGGKRLGKSFYSYRQAYFDSDYMGYSYEPKPFMQEKITELISDLCVSMKAKDYLELPEMVEHIIPVKLDAKAKKKYNEMEKEAVLELEDSETIDATSAAALSNKLLQLSNGAIYDENGMWHEIHQAKIDAFLETIEQLQGKPVLVFYHFKHDAQRILKALEKTNLSARKLERPEDQKDWNAGKIDVLLTHPASSAYGLNLQEGGNHIIWFGLNWSYELYVQANKRLHRQGQKNTVFIHHLVTQGTRDEDVMAALGKKENCQNYVMDSLKARIKKYTGKGEKK